MKSYSDRQYYIMAARKRLLRNDYDSSYSFRNKDIFYINNRIVTPEQLTRLKTKINDIQCSNFLVEDTLDKLIIDRREFAELDEDAKLRYIFELSKIFAVLKKAER